MFHKISFDMTVDMVEIIGVTIIKVNSLIYRLKWQNRDMFSSRLKKLIEEKGVTQQEVASAIGIKQPSLNAWLTGRTRSVRSENLIPLATYFGVDPNWLLTGRKERAGKDFRIAESEVIYTLPEPGRPVLLSVTAGGIREAIARIHPDNTEWIVPDSVESKDSSAWLIIENDSMEPDFSEGDLILIDPDSRWENGSYVVAANAEGHWTFKKLVRDGCDWYLKPLNEKYPTRQISEDMVIVGRAVEHRPRSRRI